MKKFVFTLQKPYEIKKKSRDALLAERDGLKRRMDAIRTQREATVRAMQKEGAKLAAEGGAGVPAARAACYGGYIAGALDDIRKQDERMKELQKKMEENTGKLMRVINEIKVMEKIRDEQMQEYHKELRKNDDKVLEDFLCGRI